MSGFLARVAARAVGLATAAQPRLRARFEEAVQADLGLEVIEAEVAATPGAPRRTPSEPEPAVARPRRRPAAGTPAPPPAVAPVRAEAPTPPLPSVVHPAAELDEPASTGPDGASVDESGERVATPAAAVLPVGAPSPQAVTAAPARRAAPASPPPVAPALLSAARPEPPAVSVHIGRLEVRANLQQPSPQRMRRESTPTQELSLADYLGGRRATR
jgi:hypothetical protein